MSLLIRNGTVITASDMYRGDVYIEGERITTIGAELTMAADRVIDAAGKYVLPGGIDVHTHLDTPFAGGAGGPPPRAPRPPSSTSPFSIGARRCTMPWTHGWPRPRARRRSTTAST
jgi:cytosine/adenosine deaminase-related metal-dependent hydrolase